MQFIGQKSNLELIDKWTDLPSFTIIQGDEHTGKQYLLLYLCEKFKLNYYKADVSVNAIRTMIEKMIPNSKTVYHLDNFDKASLAAKNALLKITEEPLYGNYIVVTGGPQLKTLESRAVRILMAPYSEEEVFEYMQPYFLDKTVQKAMFEVGINSPAKVYFYKEYEKIEGIINFAKEVASRITALHPDFIIEMMGRFEDRYDNKIDAYMLFLNILINILENKIIEQHYYSYMSILTVLLNGKRSLLKQPTLKRKMLLFKMFYTIYTINKEENIDNETFKGSKRRNSSK